MSTDLVLKAIADSPCPISTQTIFNKVAGVETIEQISKSVYHLWKSGKIRRHVIDGRYAYSLADAEENIALPPEAKMTTITPTPTRLSEAKAQAVRKLREAVVAEAKMTTITPTPTRLSEAKAQTVRKLREAVVAEAPVSPPMTEAPSEVESLEAPIATAPPPRPNPLILLEDDADHPGTLRQFEADPVLREITLGMRSHGLRNAAVHVSRLRALSLWAGLSVGVAQWLLELAADIERQAS